MSAKMCPHCDRGYDRTIDRKCPHCEKQIKIGSRKCPACTEIFQLSKSKNRLLNNQPHCPKCGIRLHFPSGKLNGQTMLYADKECAETIVRLVEEVISSRGNILFEFEPGGERSAELVHAYALLDRSKTFLRKQQNDLGLSPHAFTVELVKLVLADPFWKDNLKSLAMIRNNIGRYAQDLFRDKKLRFEQNEARAMTFVDYSVLTPTWN